MNIIKSGIVALALILPCSLVFAGPIITTGAGSAVTSVDAAAYFEDTASLGLTYTEDGIDFKRVGLTTNNNGCGFAGCLSPWFSGFGGGNYMYGVGSSGSYFSIKSTGSNIFYAMEFQVANGFNNDPTNVQWSTYLGGILQYSGSLNVAKWGVFGIADAGGFDELHYTGAGNAPAFDNLKAQYTSVETPEPMSLAMLSLGLISFGFFGRRKHK